MTVLNLKAVSIAHKTVDCKSNGNRVCAGNSKTIN